MVDFYHSIDKEADIIYHAPSSLKRKKSALSELLDEAKKNGVQELIDDCEIYLRAIYEAERLMDAEGVFSVEISSYDADKRFIEILEVGDNLDYCCLQAIGKSIDGAWHIGAVKHGHVGIDVLPCVSPLYTMKIYKGELPPDFKMLESISNFVDGREENGTMLWNALAFASENTDEELLACLENIKEDGKHD